VNIDPYFEQQGSGPPVVFIHGSFATTSTWKKMIEQLAVSHHCISIKLPGHCGTPDPHDFSHPTLETELAIIERVVNRLTSEPIHLVGHSFGGVIALAQALRGSINLAQMTLFEPVAVWVLRRAEDQEMNLCVQEFLTKYRRDASNKKPYACGQVIEFWGGKGAFDSLPDFIKDGMESLVQNNIRHWDIDAATSSDLSDLQNCTVPTRLVCGDKSSSVVHAICKHLSRQMPNSNTFVIKGASHFLVTSHTNACIEVLRDQSLFK